MARCALTGSRELSQRYHMWEGYQRTERTERALDSINTTATPLLQIPNSQSVESLGLILCGGPVGGNCHALPPTEAEPEHVLDSVVVKYRCL